MKVVKVFILIAISIIIAACGGSTVATSGKKNSTCNPKTAITIEQLKDMIGKGEDVTKVNTCAITNMSNLFDSSLYPVNQRATVDRFNQDISSWDTSRVIYMNEMFLNHKGKAFNYIGSWNVSSVKSMEGMFLGAKNFNTDISSWDVSSVESMESMFEGAESFNQNINRWNTKSLKNTKKMFFNAILFNKPLDKWDVSKVVTMEHMFHGAISFNQNLNSWDTNSVKYMTSMFEDATNFNGEIGLFNTAKVTTMNNMFKNATSFNKDIGGWDVQMVENMSGMFNGAVKFNQIIANWDIRNLLFAEDMFKGVKLSTFNYDILISTFTPTSGSHKTIQKGVTFNGGFSKYSKNSKTYHDLLTNKYKWKITDGGFDGNIIPTITILGDKELNVTKGTKYIDAGATAIDSYDGNITNKIKVTSNVDINKIGDYSVVYDVNNSLGNSAKAVRVVHVISNCNKATAITRAQLIAKIANGDDVTKVNTCAITDMSHLFDASSPNSPYNSSQQSIVSHFQQDISSWDTSNVVDMSYMFYGNGFPTNYISKWNVSSVTNMSYMFAYAGFNTDISKWDVSRVNDMSHMFEYSSFNKPIGDWNTSSVTNMSYMFMSAGAFDQPIGKWDVSSVRDMEGMFSGVIVFNQDIGSWDVSNVSNMKDMFMLNQSFNQDIGAWNVSNVTNMKQMFHVTKFNQDISSWDIRNVTNMDFMIANSGMSVDNYSNLLISWSKLNVKYNVPFYVGAIEYRKDAQSARDILDKTYNWAITDGGSQ